MNLEVFNENFTLNFNAFECIEKVQRNWHREIPGALRKFSGRTAITLTLRPVHLLELRLLLKLKKFKVASEIGSDLTSVERLNLSLYPVLLH